MGISIIVDEVKRKGLYQESAVSLMNGYLHGARSLDDIVDLAKGAGLSVATEPWRNPNARDGMDYLVTFKPTSIAS